MTNIRRQLIEIFPAQDFKDDKMWYSIKLNNNEVGLINSGGEIIPARDQVVLEQRGILLIHNNVTMNYLEENEYIRFKDDQRVNFNNLFNEVRELIKLFIVFEDENYYDLISLWLIGTYFYRCFNYYPYIHINGQKRSGKSKLLEIIYQVAFNPFMAANITQAVLFRTVHLNGATMLIDEFENVNSQTQGALLQILNSGFQYTGRVSRCGSEKRNYTPETYYTYSPKAFAGISRIEETLSDRCITIPMISKSDNQYTERFRLNDFFLNKLKAIRTKLYILGLNDGPIAHELYNNAIDSTLPNELNDREKDVWESIFTLAALVNNDEVEERIYDLAVTNHVARIINDPIIILVKALKSAYSVAMPIRPGEHRFETESFYNLLLECETQLLPIYDSINKLTSVLRNLGIVNVTYTLGRRSDRAYIITDELMAQILSRHGLD